MKSTLSSKGTTKEGGKDTIRTLSHGLIMEGFLEQYSVVDQNKVEFYGRVFECFDEDADGFLDGAETLEAIDKVLPADVLSDSDFTYIYRVLELVDRSVVEEQISFQLFCTIVSLAQKISTLDTFIRGMLDRFDFKALEAKFFNARRLFNRLVDQEDANGQRIMTVECLMNELRLGGLQRKQELQIEKSLGTMKHLDILDFITHLPLFVMIHSAVVENPLLEVEFPVFMKNKDLQCN